MGTVAQAKKNIKGGHLHGGSVWMFQLSQSKHQPPTSGAKVTHYNKHPHHCFARAFFSLLACGAASLITTKRFYASLISRLCSQ